MKRHVEDLVGAPIREPVVELLERQGHGHLRVDTDEHRLWQRQGQLDRLGIYRGRATRGRARTATRRLPRPQMYTEPKPQIQNLKMVDTAVV